MPSASAMALPSSAVACNANNRVRSVFFNLGRVIAGAPESKISSHELAPDISLHLSYRRSSLQVGSVCEPDLAGVDRYQWSIGADLQLAVRIHGFLL